MTSPQGCPPSTQEAAARKAGLDPDSGEVSEAMAALVDRGYVKGTSVLGQRVYMITANGIEKPQDQRNCRHLLHEKCKP
jgi:hypothetical protein